MTTRPLQFVRRGQTVTLHDVPPDRTLLEVLREDLHCTDTKEGCNEGDCGACTVVLGEDDGGRLKYRAVNSCIRLAHSIQGQALWTAQDLLAPDGSLHPAQRAMVQCHASQCGFCTPGFVMSLFGMYQNHVAQGRPITRALAQQDLAGNLCRCTGYQPILEAAQSMAQLPRVHVDEAEALKKLKQLSQAGQAAVVDSAYFLPSSLAELRRIETYPNHLAIGAAVTLAEAFAALVADRPQLQAFANRFAGLTVRNSGTLGGNVANGSPIGDAMPLLIALGANLVLMSTRGHRELPLEQLYTGYRQNMMAPDELLAWIKVPKPVPQELSRVYKVSKRFDDDISALCLAVALHLEGGEIVRASIGVGGVAATPVRASQTEALLTGQPWTQTTVQRAMLVLRQEFSPISDLRASNAYRVQVLGNLLQRFWLESQGARAINLESAGLEELLT